MKRLVLAVSLFQSLVFMQLAPAQTSSAQAAVDLMRIRTAAEQGNPVAQRALGVMYYTGDGVPQDYVQAASWHAKAAERGDADSQRMLGDMYSAGQGVPQDSAKAVNWYRRAAEQHNDDAQRMLGVMYLDGKGVPQDYAQAANWIRKAAEKGNAKAQILLIALYGNGEGVPQDFVLAYVWANLAASTSAMERLREGRDMLARKLTPEQLAEGQRLSSKWKAGQSIERESKR